MTKDDMEVLFEDQIKNFSSAVFSDKMRDNWFDEGQIDIARTTRCTTTDSTVNLTASTREYDLPTDMLGLLHINYNNGTTYTRLHRTTLDDLEVNQDYPNETAATPEFYYIKQGATPTVGLYPKPASTVANGLSVHYLQRPTNLTTPGLNPSIPEPYHRLIIQYALYRCLQKDAKTDTADRYYAQYQEELGKMRHDLRNWDRKQFMRLAPFTRDHRDRYTTRDNRR